MPIDFSSAYRCSEDILAARTPAFAVETLFDLYGARDPVESLRTLLRERPDMLDAVYAASPALYDAALRWIAGDENDAERVALRLLAYVGRMALRATPFALFAGIGLARVGDGDEPLAIAPRSAWRSRSRIDAQALTDAASRAENDPAVRGAIRYSFNPWAFERGDRLFVTDPVLTRPVAQGSAYGVEQRPVSLRLTPALRFLRERTAAPVPFDAIAEELAARFETPASQTRTVVERLARAGILISELRPSPCGDPQRYVIDVLKRIGSPEAHALVEAGDAMERLDAIPLDQRRHADYRAIEAPMQLDLRVELEGCLPRAVLQDAGVLAHAYLLAAPVMRMTKFRERFVERYEGTTRLVPLLELADPELGISLPADGEEPPAASPERDAHLRDLLTGALLEGKDEIALSLDRLAELSPRLSNDARELMPSFEIGFSILAASAEAVARGEYRVARGGFSLSPNAGRSMGRFAHLLDDDERERWLAGTRDHHPGEAVAELVFPPAEMRYYNVCVRPNPHAFEIRAGTAAGTARALDPRELWVGLDGRGFFLWSSELDQPVGVRETHLFNTGYHAPNLCRLLTLIGRDGERVLRGFDWGQLAAMPFLPRVRCGRTILAPAIWQLDGRLLRSSSEAAAELDRWRARLRVGRYVALCDGDNRLPIDLDSSIAPAIVADQARSRRGARLVFEELLPGPDDCWVSGPGGRYAPEFVASFVRTALQPRAIDPVPEPVRERQVFGPASRWVYAQIDAPQEFADELIAKHVAPVSQRAVADGSADRWFFVRYQGRRPHVRWRIRAGDASPGSALRDEVAGALEPLLRAGSVEAYRLETYDPEYERYGGVGGMALAEELFHLDSERCAALLGPPMESARRIDLAVASFDRLAQEIGLEPEEIVDAFEVSERIKLTAEEREAVKALRLQRYAALPEFAAFAHYVREGTATLPGDLFHMHCNRLGLRRPAETRARAILRQLGLARRAAPAQVRTQSMGP